MPKATTSVASAARRRPAGVAYPSRQVSEVDRAGRAVEQSDADKEQERSDEVDRDVWKRGAQGSIPARYLQQEIGSQEDDLEHHEEIEEVAGEKGSRQAESEQEQERQRTRHRPAALRSRPKRQNGDQQQHGQKQHEERGETVGDKDDAKRRSPAAKTMNQHLAEGRGADDADRQDELKSGEGQGDPAVPCGAQRQQPEQDAGHPGDRERSEGQPAHP